MNPVQSYLRLEGAYADLLGLRWAVGENVLEACPSSGSYYVATYQTWAFAEEIARFLEGFASQRPLIHFEHLLHLLQLLRHDPASDTASPRCERLWRLYRDYRANVSCAGAFAAQLCPEVPQAPEAHAVQEIVQQLRSQNVTIHWLLLGHGVGTEESLASAFPPGPPHLFEQLVLQCLDRFTDDEVRYWLQHGRGPVDRAGAELARALPTSAVEQLTSLLERPRLRGVGAFVPQLNGALTLPPRQLTFQHLPLGGFTDVTTHGKLEDLLLSQFALDEIDFFRRYAERELLFYRREDPHTQMQQELVVLLDQGVRTWGDVRLVLTAAVLALARQGERGKRAFFLATTSRPALFDPATIAADELGDILEQSDFTTTPAAALAALLEQAPNCPRDIVVLTHPASLQHAALRQAAQQATADTRLFALALDRLGQAVLSELRAGGPVVVRQFHVDFTKASLSAASSEDDGHQECPGSWTGDIEPVGFPFAFGIHGKIQQGAFDFDYQERYLLTGCKSGLLHLWNLDGSLQEMLPRGFCKGKAVSEVQQVLSVADGFIVVGHTHRGSEQVVVHYRWAHRHVYAWSLGSSQYRAFHYSLQHHCLLAADQSGGGCSIDLSTRERYATNLGGGSERSRAAWEADVRGEVLPRNVPIGIRPGPGTSKFGLFGNVETGEVMLVGVSPPLGPFRLFEDGKPVFAILDAQQGGPYLILRVPGQDRSQRLAIFRKDATPLKVLSIAEPKAYRLSTDGKLLAQQVSDGVIRISATCGNVHGHTRVGGFNQYLRFYVGKNVLYIQPGKSSMYHRLSWQTGSLAHTIVHQLPDDLEPGARDELATYDDQRWVKWVHTRHIVVGDCFGQVAVFDANRQLVCMFATVRSHLAGWLPDGTVFGAATLSGKPAHPDAAARFGRALVRSTAPTQRRESNVFFVSGT